MNREIALNICETHIIGSNARNDLKIAADKVE